MNRSEARLEALKIFLRPSNEARLGEVLNIAANVAEWLMPEQEVSEAVINQEVYNVMPRVAEWLSAPEGSVPVEVLGALTLWAKDNGERQEIVLHLVGDLQKWKHAHDTKPRPSHYGPSPELDPNEIGDAEPEDDSKPKETDTSFIGDGKKDAEFPPNKPDNGPVGYERQGIYAERPDRFVAGFDAAADTKRKRFDVV